MTEVTIIRTFDDYTAAPCPVALDHRTAPAIIGTEKQIAWATKVRAELLVALNEVVMMQLGRMNAKGGAELVQKALDDLRPVIDHMLVITDAGWWLDRRHLGAMDLLRDGAQAYRAAV